MGNLLLKGGLPPLRNFYVHTHTFSCANKIGAIYESLQVNVEVEQGSNCTFTHDPSYIASIFFDMHVKFICIHKLLNLSAVHHHQMDDEYNGRLSPPKQSSLPRSRDSYQGYIVQQTNQSLSDCLHHWFDCFCSVCRYFATGSADALVSLWDLDELVCVRTFSRLE